MTTDCRGCGAPNAAPSPAMTGPEHCGKCLPWGCESCGEMTSLSAPCDCWVQLASLPLADLKGLLALGGLSVERVPS